MYDLIQRWLVAELKAANVYPDKPVGIWEEDVPSAVGVWIGTSSDDKPHQFLDSCDVHIRVIGATYQACAEVSRAVDNALEFNPGQGIPWHVNPRTKGLALKSFRRKPSPGAERDGEGSVSYAKTIIYTAMGKPLSVIPDPA